MDKSLTQKIRNDFDCLALHDQEGWDHNNHYHRFLLKQLPSQRQVALDIGCGTGEFSRLLAKHFERVIAIDLSPNMIQVAQQRSRRFSNLDFQVADVLQWEPGAEQFDAIISITTLHHLPVERLLPNLKAVLKPGGRLIILDLLEHESWRDQLSDFVAVPLNWLFQVLKNSHIRQSPEATAAMKEHLCTDKYLTISQAQQIYISSLRIVKVRQHLFWRYSVVWEKPAAA
ncbi:bifunctional 2-polyprenyl-6-hydroxyphenol methylase/3-demethylubiquinol 3-O-methyltransferase UbiG [Synechococcus sp. PCC 6312]|uniref:class I SAM-dependent methyltransferase n=1 Tax=Synechococcus sp. (strain ATCC 27167 / PCC 6312) TaxID=195253 RepID=UPI00029F2015|nr:class I SAM-dependent methyltransferase [Synechococcus sp. PCC 6312]AFY59612.1 methylase involved in ubiquinone/menaquinone biosynthesis [Synechococcus sp. PCC 6312]